MKQLSDDQVRQMQPGDRVFVPPTDEEKDDPQGVILSMDEDGYVRVQQDDGAEVIFSRCQLSLVAE